MKFRNPLKPMFNGMSVFIKCTMLITATTLIVASILMFQSQRMVNSAIEEGILELAAEITQAAGARNGGAMRFGDASGVQVAMDRILENSSGRAVYAIATNSSNEVIATARLKHDGQVGRMAVLHEYRHSGIGIQLLQYVLKTALDQNFTKLYLHAQVSAIPFYEKLGFSTCSDVFYEANIPHREMSKIIC